ncbi:MAG: hypothetical protein COB53_11155 [Elusimicrobia bacterium]|nr:MAG: hypothetical protein COB53_11155 [Elusimicrobiota bacterium]
MKDVSSRERLAFLGLLGTVILFAAVPSLVLIEKGTSYYRFLTGWEPGVLKQMSVDYVPHTDSLQDAELPEIEFVEFKIQDPKAKSVKIAGDFNGWRGDGYPLVSDRGTWRLIIPLPPGTYRYGFLVDDRWTIDPNSKETEMRNGREVSLREVVLQ